VAIGGFLGQRNPLHTERLKGRSNGFDECRTIRMRIANNE